MNCSRWSSFTKPWAGDGSHEPCWKYWPQRTPRRHRHLMDISHGEPLLSQKESAMTKTRFSTVVGLGMLASSLFLLPMTTATFAQTTNPTPQTRVVETLPCYEIGRFHNTEYTILMDLFKIVLFITYMQGLQVWSSFINLPHRQASDYMALLPECLLDPFNNLFLSAIFLCVTEKHAAFW